MELLPVTSASGDRIIYKVTARCSWSRRLPDRLTQITYAIRLGVALPEPPYRRVRTHSGFFCALSVAAAVSSRLARFSALSLGRALQSFC